VRPPGETPSVSAVSCLQSMPIRSALVVALLLAALGQGIVEAPAAEYCPDTQSEIQTDRPDVTNSSFVVPNGSLQAENGINLTARRAARTIDGTNTRVRLGVARCIELLADLPDYFRSVQGGAPTGFSDVAPAVKAQLGPLPGGVVLSATAGLGFPTGQAGSRVTVIILMSSFLGRGRSEAVGVSVVCSHNFGSRVSRRAMRSPKQRLSYSEKLGPTLTSLSNTLVIIRITADRAKLSTPAVLIGLPLLSKSIFMQVLD